MSPSQSSRIYQWYKSSYAYDLARARATFQQVLANPITQQSIDFGSTLLSPGTPPAVSWGGLGATWVSSEDFGFGIDVSGQ